MRNFYLAAAIAGTILPWTTFGPFLLENGMSPFGILSALYANGAAAGLATDFFITVGVFWIFIITDSRRIGLKGTWPLLPAALFIGLSMAVPTYFYMREGKV